MSHKVLEVNLITEFKKRPNYHLEALYFVTQALTNNNTPGPEGDISKLIGLLKPKTGSIEQVMELLKNCFIKMAEYDSSFKCYLAHFPGGSVYEEHPPTHVQVATSSMGEASRYPNPMPIENLSMDDRLTDEFIIELRNHLDVSKLHDFAVVGLKIPDIRFRNSIDSCTTPEEKFSNVFNLWKREAPIESMMIGGGMPSFTKRGLRKALESAKHNDAIVSLKLL